MDLDLAEKFFVAYLKEKKLKYGKKAGVYTVALDKTHKKWYNTEKLICTFDAKVSKDKKVELLGVGNYIFDSIAAQFLDEVPVSNLSIADTANDLMEVNEHLHELNKGTTPYNISEGRGEADFVLFEVTIKTVNKKQQVQVPLLLLEDTAVLAEGFENNEFEPVEEDVRVSEPIERGLEDLPKLVADELSEAEKEHEKDMKDLIQIQLQHSEDQYEELQKKEGEILRKMQDMREKSMSASSFDSQSNYDEKIRKLKLKHKELVQKNASKRQEIKELFEKEKLALKNRELHVDAKVLSVAHVSLPLLPVVFDDKDSYYYIPALKKFAKKGGDD